MSGHEVSQPITIAAHWLKDMGIMNPFETDGDYMGSRVFLVNQNCYYDLDTKALHGPAGEEGLDGRLVNVLDFFLETPKHIVRVKFGSDFVSGGSFHLKKSTFKNYISEINGIGKRVGLGAEKLIRQASLHNNESQWTLRVHGQDDDPHLSAAVADRPSVKIAIGRADLALFSGDAPIGYVPAVDTPGSWFYTADGSDHERLVVGEMNRYAHALVQQSRSVLTEFQIETTIDVSKWPKSPFHVKQTVCQTRVGDNSHIFHEAATFQDLNKASSFRYTKLVIRDADPARQMVLSISGLPHYSDLHNSGNFSFPTPEGFDVQCYMLEDTLNDPDGRHINVLHYEVKGEGLTIVLENWEPHHSYYARNSVLQSGVRDRRRKHDAFYAASLDIIAPKEREYSIELSSEYNAWSIGENRFFREMVYQPSIKAEIVGADANPEYDFTLHQYSSQSPFWRRQDGKHYVEDLVIGVNTPQRLWWRYDNQWLMLGEGYAIVVDAQRR